MKQIFLMSSLIITGLIAATTLTACNAPNTTAAPETTAPTPGNPPILVSSKATIQHNGEVIAHVFDIKMGEVAVYILRPTVTQKST